MKLSEVVVKEVKNIGVLNLALTALENLVFFLLGYWDITVLWGSLFGWAISLVSFILLGISVQNALGRGEQNAQQYMHFTYMGRMLLMACGLILAMNVSQLNWISAAFPLIFTRISIFIMHLRKKEE